jgi:DNA polymerase (family 10)
VITPPLLIRRLQNVSPATARALQQQLGILTPYDLELALDDGRIRRELGEPEESLLHRVSGELAQETPVVHLGRAWELLEPILATAVPFTSALEPAGDVRRSEPIVSTLALVGRSDDPSASIESICRLPGMGDLRHSGAKRCIVAHKGHEIDIRIAAADEYGSVLFQATGSRAHIAAVSKRRKRPELCADEAHVYRQAALRFVAPELRHDTGEIEAAARGELPVLVERADIRGDLHVHTTYSDGMDDLDTMIDACRALGYEYVAITDHSERANAARTLSLGEVSRQRDEIASARERFRGIRILHGIEVDIMPDGRLDFADEVLETFDIVLASLHDQAGHDGRRLTDRAIAALRHPLVSVFTHPQNRIPGRRESYPMDFDRLYAAAAETGTALEIDGAPGHIDLDGEHARAAIAAGVTLAIDSDSHRARVLDRQMRMGVGTARRGWVDATRVLNTMPLEDVEAFVARKRSSSA